LNSAEQGITVMGVIGQLREGKLLSFYLVGYNLRVLTFRVVDWLVSL